ncbi:hypothetical protein KCU64_g23463, partial [Aureobasidium melanogenum]
HSQLKTGHPVRSAIHKQLNGRLVLRWVTTWESLLLYVLSFIFANHLQHSHRNSFANDKKMADIGQFRSRGTAHDITLLR